MVRPVTVIIRENENQVPFPILREGWIGDEAIQTHLDNIVMPPYHHIVYFYFMGHDSKSEPSRARRTFIFGGTQWNEFL